MIVRTPDADAHLGSKLSEAKSASDAPRCLWPGSPLGELTSLYRVRDSSRRDRASEAPAAGGGDGQHRQVRRLARPVAVARGGDNRSMVPDGECRGRDLLDAALFDIRDVAGRDELARPSSRGRTCSTATGP
jgi:hypothetical protein